MLDTKWKGEEQCDGVYKKIGKEEERRKTALKKPGFLDALLHLYKGGLLVRWSVGR